MLRPLDLQRNESIKTQLLDSMNFLGKTAPRFTVGSSWTQSGTTFTNGDLVITYTLPVTVTDSDPRAGWRIKVKTTYHQDIIIPLIGTFLPKDASGRLPLGAEVTMVLN